MNTGLNRGIEINVSQYWAGLIIVIIKGQEVRVTAPEKTSATIAQEFQTVPEYFAEQTKKTLKKSHENFESLAATNQKLKDNYVAW